MDSTLPPEKSISSDHATAVKAANVRHEFIVSAADTLGEVTDQVPDWQEAVLLENKSLRAKWTDDSAVPTGRVMVLHTPAPASANSKAQVSLSAVPPSADIYISLLGPGVWTLGDVGATCRVHVYREQMRTKDDQNALTLRSSVGGIVAVTNAGTEVGTVEAEDGCTATVQLVAGIHNLALVPEETEVQIHGGVIRTGRCTTLHLFGDVEISPAGQATPLIGTLIVHGDRKLTFARDCAATTVQKLIGAPGGGAHLELERLQSEATVHRVSTQELTVRRLRNLTISGDTHIAVKSVASATGSGVGGEMKISCNKLSTAARIQFGDDTGTPTLSAGRGSILTGVSGSVAIANVSGCHLEAAPRSSFLLTRIDSTTSSSQVGACKDSFLRGFRLPGGLEGRTLLTSLAEAHHLEPSTASLPGWDLRIPRLHRLLPKKNSRRQQDAELMRELHRLAIERGASGSARTKIGWCAQRLRHATTNGIAEPVALVFYRLLGYGERPGPPLLTWAVLSLVAGAWTLGFQPDLTVAGLVRLLEQALHAGLGTVAAVMRVGTPPADTDPELVVRAFLSIPLVVGLLSLRNYVRAGTTTAKGPSGP